MVTSAVMPSSYFAAFIDICVCKGSVIVHIFHHISVSATTKSSHTKIRLSHFFLLDSHDPIILVYYSLHNKFEVPHVIFIPPVITACLGVETSTGVFQQLQGPRSWRTGQESECTRCTPTDRFKTLLYFGSVRK